MRYGFIILLFSIQSAFAQGLYNNGAIISINNGAAFNVQGNATNNGTIINNGNFLVSGFWLNNETYDPGTGDFTLNSSGDQVVNHNAQSFTRLVINGGGIKFFLADIEILESLDLTNGHLVSQDGARIIADENAAIREGTNNAHVVGPFYQRGNGDKLFPVGNGSVYLPVMLLGIENNTDAVGVLLLEPNPITQINEGITEIANSRAWNIDLSLANNATALVELPLVNDSFLANINEAVVAFAPEGSDFFSSIGNSASSGTPQAGFLRSAQRINNSGLAAVAFFREAEVVALPPEVYNVVTPNGDSKHDFLKIQHIESYPDNTVHIFNRWGDELFRIRGYDNNERIFAGRANLKNTDELPEGTYYYVIHDGIGGRYSGFFLLKR
ncbi:MAG TPA: gliding motility-associated C-terminal domain-containing protein [Cyclobacteriaceae bacterium]|nr:gliding motility-associated C-terminal domain-containing protein [Cyclobacteriaceae bacterium]